MLIIRMIFNDKRKACDGEGKMIGEKYYYINENGILDENIDYDRKIDWLLNAIGNMFSSVEKASENLDDIREIWHLLQSRAVKIIPFNRDDMILDLLASAENYMEGLS